jgi:hypothetical protein
MNRPCVIFVVKDLGADLQQLTIEDATAIEHWHGEAKELLHELLNFVSLARFRCAIEFIKLVLAKRQRWDQACTIVQ